MRRTLNKVFPDHWSFLLGELALFCFVLLVLTGTFLTFFYVPSSAQVTYGGSYAPLAGSDVSGTTEYDRSGGEVKRLHPGMAARSGIGATG